MLAEDFSLLICVNKVFFFIFQDYEVSLSIGHLASLYNYDMEKYELAERLYLRSIDIGKKPCTLFKQLSF